MPNIAQHQSAKTTKLLLIGDSGSGKTGSLCSLARAGYKVHVLDLDNGLDIVKNLLTAENTPYPGAAANFDYITLTEPMIRRQVPAVNINAPPARGDVSAPTLIPQPKVWVEISKVLQDWKDGDKSLGPVTSWTEQDVLVIDSLSRASTAAMNFQRGLSGRLTIPPWQSDYHLAQGYVESLLQMLYDTSVQCNVIVIAHVTYIGEETGPLKGYPETLGKALPPKVGRYFNSCLMARSVGQGTNIKRKILTNTSGIVELKNTNPLEVKPEYDLDTGLAEYFRDIRKPIGTAASVVPLAKPGH